MNFKFEPINPTSYEDQFDRTKLFTNLREIKGDELGYITTALPDSSIASVHEGTLLTAKKPRVLALCCPSEKTISDGAHGQDSFGVAQITNDNGHDMLLVAQADGVGETLFSEIASGIATQNIIANGTHDLQANLALVTAELSKFDAATLPRPTNDTPDLMRELLNARRVDTGSQTTCNQHLINIASGSVQSLILGDGEIIVMRISGQLERTKLHNDNSQPARLSTNGVSSEGRQHPTQTL